MSSDLTDQSSPLRIELHLPSGLRSATEARAAAKALAAQAWQCDETQFDLVFEPGVFVPRSPVVEVVTPAQYLAYKRRAMRYSRHLMLATLLVAMAVLSAWRLAVDRERMSNEARKQALDRLSAQRKAAAGQATEITERQIAQTKLWESLRPKLELDLNPVFDKLEEVQIAQVRLMNLELDASTRSVVLSYELASVVQIPALTQALADKSDDKMACQLIAARAVNSALQTQWRCTF